MSNIESIYWSSGEKKKKDWELNYKISPNFAESFLQKKVIC